MILTKADHAEDKFNYNQLLTEEVLTISIFSALFLPLSYHWLRKVLVL